MLKKNQIHFWLVVKAIEIESQDEIQILKRLYLGVAMIDSIKSYPRSLFCRSIQSIFLLHNVIDFVNPKEPEITGPNKKAYTAERLT